MADVYILYSQTLKKNYVGSCKCFELRLAEHLSEEISCAFTAKASDWEEVLVLRGLVYAQARRIEKHIKSMKSSVYIKNLIKYPEMREKLLVRFK
jgi:putative endonuclease